MYKPEYLQKWTPNITGFDSWSNYMGPDFSEWYLAPVCQTRDSGILERSNFETVEKDLEQFNTWIEEDDEEVQTVANHRFGHWGPGWYEIILIHATNEKALKAADEWSAALSDYPVADEEAYSEKEWNEIAEYWEGMSMSDRIDMIQDGNGSVFAARRDEVPDCCYERLSRYVNE